MDALAVQTDNLVDGFPTGDPVPETFSLEDDMPQVERDYLAELLKAEAFQTTDLRLANRLEIIERFRLCRQQGRWSNCPKCNCEFISRFYCKARICDTCARIYGRQVYKKVMELVNPYFANRKKGWTLAMLTLSESTSKYRGRFPDQDDTKRFNRNVAAFCRLFYGKHRGRFSRSGKVVEDRRRFQGAGTIGVNEFGQDNNNLHCHVLLYGPWIPHEKLLNAWVRITGGDRGCFIEPIRNPGKAAHYVAKYVTKPPRFYDLHRAVEYVNATKGTRRIKAGGVFYNRLKFEKVQHDPDRCPFCQVDLLYNGVRTLKDCNALNLHHVRKNPELYETDRLQKIVRLLPGGATPVGLPSAPPVWQAQPLAS